MFMSGCQGFFFFTLAQTADGEEPDGNRLNNINLLAMTVVVVAGAKGMALGARKQFVQGRRSIQGAIAGLEVFRRDPYGYVVKLLVASPSEVTLLLSLLGYLFGFRSCHTRESV